MKVAPRTQGCGGQGDTPATTTEIHQPPPSKLRNCEPNEPHLEPGLKNRNHHEDQAFTPGGGGEDLPKTDFFDFVVSPPPHCASTDGVSDEESFLHRTTCRSIGYLQQGHEEHEASRDLHGSPFIKETNNNTLTALPPVSTITGSLSHHHHHHHVRTHHSACNVQQSNEQTPMDQSDCDYWATDESKEQTCNILLEDLNKYCWSAHANAQSHGNDNVNVHQGSNEHHQGVGRGCSANDRQNTDGAIYTLTVLNNEANSMDALDCCKSPAPTSSDSWSLRPNLDLDAILSMEPASTEQEHDQGTNVTEVSRTVNDRFHPDRFSVASSQYATDDSGFVESKELCGRGSSSSGNCAGGDNNNDWKLSDQNLQEAAAAAAAAVAVGAGDSAESLLRSALQGKLYTGPAQVVSSSSPSAQGSTMSMPLDQTTYRPGDYEKLKSIANEVVESYCSLEPVCNVSATTTVMYTLDPTSGSLGTITLPADLGQVSTVTVVTAAQQDVLQQQAAPRAEVEQQQSANQLQITPSRVVATKAPKKYCRRTNRNSSNSNAASNGNSGAETGGSSGGQQQGGSGGSPGSVQRKERSLHYCSICSKGFKDKYSVNVHIRTHTGEKPFACSLCGKSFRQKAHLAKHYQTHVTQKPSVQQQAASGSGASNNGNSGNPSPSGETSATTASNVTNRSQAHQVSVDPAGSACNPPKVISSTSCDLDTYSTSGWPTLALEIEIGKVKCERINWPSTVHHNNNRVLNLNLASLLLLDRRFQNIKQILFNSCFELQICIKESANYQICKTQPNNTRAKAYNAYIIANAITNFTILVPALTEHNAVKQDELATHSRSEKIILWAFSNRTVQKSCSHEFSLNCESSVITNYHGLVLALKTNRPLRPSLDEDKNLLHCSI
ncbi:Zinc finger and BTB domain-containing protein 48 [Melipona quadrifasciata]|uniref:Zinc finger and BTB domain-containing protein 48 n=1 Tax=Melipona quadrifasciata TaxID=166423 RepID=A0A0M9A8V8_9HYME|nr:Zinc finger and BTB domain-containing protein 48 [Melipona quadrifasciata]